MSVIRPRTRLVYFRVSDDEFKQYGELCKTAGARSISDLARSAMERMIRENTRHSSDEITERLCTLDEAIAELTGKIQQLNMLLTERAQG